jgi:hypothetical protein
MNTSQHPTIVTNDSTSSGSFFAVGERFIVPKFGTIRRDEKGFEDADEFFDGVKASKYSDHNKKRRKKEERGKRKEEMEEEIRRNLAKREEEMKEEIRRNLARRPMGLDFGDDNEVTHIFCLGSPLSWFHPLIVRYFPRIIVAIDPPPSQPPKKFLVGTLI